MYLFVYISLLSGGVVARSRSSNEAPHYDIEQANRLFEEFILTHSKVYPNEQEKQLRFEIFKQNLRNINEKNAIGKAVFEINYLADVSEEEFLRNYLGFTPNLDEHRCEIKNEVDVKKPAPESLSWLDEGVVTPVKNQGSCGSCWAFATIANMESQYALKNGFSIIFSEEELVDCSNDKRHDACEGASPVLAMSDIMKLGGIESENDYPYEHFNNPNNTKTNCRVDKSKVKANIVGCSVYQLTDEEDLKQLLAQNGPLVVSVNGKDLHNYHQGIYTKDQCSNNIIEDSHHAVVLIGYGTEDGQDYWLLKNSWGTGFGENGYFRISREDNTCGIMNVTFGDDPFPVLMYSATVHF